MAQYNVYLNATRPAAYPTYYVDATLGDDDDAGTIDAPWQTIAKVNAASLDPGDSVLFKRGETFAGKLVPVVAGNAVNYITFGAYGTGARPIIDGSGQANSMAITANYHHLRYEYIDFAGSNSSNTVIMTNAHDLYFYDCIVRDSYPEGHVTGFYAYLACYSITLNTCELKDNSANGLLTSLTCHDILCTNCVSHDNGYDGPVDYHGFYMQGGTTCDHCTAYGNEHSGFKMNDNEVEPSYYPIVRYCTSYANQCGIQLTHKNATAHNNLCYSNTNYNALLLGNAWGGYTFNFNTLVNSTNATNRGIVFTAGLSANSVVKNNLFIQDDAVVDKSCVSVLGTTTTAQFLAAYDIDYNVYYYQGSSSENVCYVEGDTGNTSKTWAEWTGDGAEPHGTHLTALPGFVTRYTDLHPADAGNLKALGVAIAGYEYDKSGVERADPPTPGCYETTV